MRPFEPWDGLRRSRSLANAVLNGGNGSRVFRKKLQRRGCGPLKDEPRISGIPMEVDLSAFRLNVHGLVKNPAMTRAQWTAEVNKMRGAYKANISPADVPKIVDYLMTQNGKT
jgi:hypothetical protein